LNCNSVTFKKMVRRDKLPDLMARVRECIESGRFLDTRHLVERQGERNINRPEVLFVLKNGHHEKKKDKFDAIYKSWNYSIRGRTVDLRELRIVVSFEVSGLLIITAIELKR